MEPYGGPLPKEETGKGQELTTAMGIIGKGAGLEAGSPEVCLGISKVSSYHLIPFVIKQKNNGGYSYT